MATGVATIAYGEVEEEASENDSVSTVQSEADEKVVQAVKELFYRARDARRPLVAQWKVNYLNLNFKPSPTQAFTQAFPEVKIANMWPIVGSITSWMTDQRPILEVAPAALPFSEFADFYQNLANDMNTVLNSIMSNYDLSSEITKVLWDVATYGIGYTKVEWEPWLADGLGDVVFRRKDAFTIYPDPLARDMASLGYICEVKQIPVAELERSYPGVKVHDAYVEESDEAPHKLDSTTSNVQPRVNYGAFSPGTTTRYMGTSKKPNSFETQVVTVIECWYRTYEIGKKKDDGTAEVEENWKCAVVSGNQLLMHFDSNEITAHGQHPYDRCVLFETGEWYGPCLVEFMTAPQQSINRVLAQIEYNLMLMGNPILAEAPQSASRNSRITNRPGQRITARPNDVGWLNPPAIQPQLAIQLLSFYESKLESISGMSAIVRGFSPTGRNSQGVMDSIQDAAFVRIRATLRELERMMRGACQKMVATIAEFYTEPRLVSIVGPDGKRTSQILKSNHFYTPDGMKNGEQLPMRFMVLADAGSQLPTSRQARAQDAAQLFALGAIDELELLKAKQWPNYGVVAARVMQAKAQAGTLGQPPGARQRTRA